LVPTMAISCQEELAQFLRGHHLVGCVWLKPFALLLGVKFVFVLHHILLRLMELLLTHTVRLLTELLLLRTSRSLLSELILLKVLLLKFFRIMELLIGALSEVLLLVVSLSLIGISISIPSITIVIASIR
jgi:hypothetical protein